MNTRKIKLILSSVSFSMLVVLNGYSQRIIPDNLVTRLDALVNLNSDQRDLAEAIFQAEADDLGSLNPNLRAIGAPKINSITRNEIRAILSARQKVIFDNTPQSKGGGMTVNIVNYVSLLDKSLDLTDAQILQMAGKCDIIYGQLDSHTNGPTVGQKELATLGNSTIEALLSPTQRAIFLSRGGAVGDFKVRLVVDSAITSSACIRSAFGQDVAIGRKTQRIIDADSAGAGLRGTYIYSLTGSNASGKILVRWQQGASGSIEVTHVVDSSGREIQL